MKKVLFVKIDSPGYSSDGMVAAFKELNYDVVGFDWQKHRFNFGIPDTRLKMIDLAVQYSPDLIFLHLQNPDILDADTARELQSVCPVVNFTFDVRQDISWLKEIAKIISWTFFACMEDVWNCNNADIENVSLLPSSCDYSWYRPLDKKLLEKNIPAFVSFERSRNGTQYPEIVFIGNKYTNTSLKFENAEQRQQMIEFLYDTYGNRFAAYGLGQREGLVNPQEEILIYNRSKIAISHNNFDRTFYTSDRLWRIMGCGTFCLSKYFSGIEKMFEKEIHLDWFKDLDELKNLIDFYLSDDKEREAVAAIGSQFVRENHTWKSRFSEAEKIIFGSKVENPVP